MRAMLLHVAFGSTNDGTPFAESNVFSVELKRMLA